VCVIVNVEKFLKHFLDVAKTHACNMLLHLLWAVCNV